MPSPNRGPAVGELALVLGPLVPFDHGVRTHRWLLVFVLAGCGDPAETYCRGLEECDLLRAGLDVEACIDAVAARLSPLEEEDVEACSDRYQSCVDDGCTALAACIDPDSICPR
jgi:hypothetical protein